MDSSTKYQKHLTLSDRIVIEKMLDNGDNFSRIANELHKSNRTISYDVKNHREFKHGLILNKKTYIPCPKVNKAPYVCNGCPSRKGCRKNRYIYVAKNANMDYKDKLSNSRKGIDLTNEEFIRMNKIITEEIKKGHSFYMICRNHKDEFSVKERTLYNYVENNYLDIINLDLPRKVRYKKRKKKSDNKDKKEYKYRKNRTYKDFLNYVDKNNDFIVEMDTVEGKKGESVLLTLLWRHSNFLLAIKLENKDSENVTKAFTKLKIDLGNELFHRYFPIILTDNGSEFSDPDSIEYNESDVYKSHVFYCDPKQSQQKGKIEVTHEYIRRFIPKGESFDSYSQEDINLIINQINNTPREMLEKSNKLYDTPYKIQRELFEESTFKYFNQFYIKSKNIILNKSIFNKKKDN